MTSDRAPEVKAALRQKSLAIHSAEVEPCRCSLLAPALLFVLINNISPPVPETTGTPWIALWSSDLGQRRDSSALLGLSSTFYFNPYVPFLAALALALESLKDISQIRSKWRRKIIQIVTQSAKSLETNLCLLAVTGLSVSIEASVLYSKDITVIASLSAALAVLIASGGFDSHSSPSTTTKHLDHLCGQLSSVDELLRSGCFRLLFLSFPASVLNSPPSHVCNTIRRSRGRLSKLA